jgi:hypothetical protein
MTTQEFSNEFDILLNSFSQQAVFGEQVSKSDLVLDEYEKSVFLTKAQNEILKNYFSDFQCLFYNNLYIIKLSEVARPHFFTAHGANFVIYKHIAVLNNDLCHSSGRANSREL